MDTGSNTKVFHFRFPGVTYCFSYCGAFTLVEAKKEIRKWLKVKRLPRGFEIWEKK